MNDESLLLGYMVWLHRLYETQKARRDLPAAIETGGLLIDARQVLLNEALVGL